MAAPSGGFPLPLFTRRQFAATALIAGLFAAAPAFAQDEGPSEVPMDQLMASGPIPDRALGSEDAPVTIVEYASMSCSHCADFHNETYPKLKEQYIDTGKVRFVFREFPIDAAAFAIAMTARCAPEDRYFDIIDLFFEHQLDWIRAEDHYGAILDLAKQAGFSEESFEACLQKQELFDGLSARRDKASKEFGVHGTPTFFINGEKLVGARSFDEIKAKIEAAL
ncbi:DsbA family protein [Afifella sp. JA880]|uniref:DsbA family protein n=1 Tax=Afifella TaxID=643217 RepID=UPI0013E37E0B